MTSGVESLGRIRAKGIALLLVTFLAGVLAGVAGARVAARRGPDLPEPALPWVRGMEGRLPRMFRDLDLTAEQRAQIADIIERGRPRTDAVMRELLPRLQAVTDSVHTEIRAILTPEQEVVWDSLLARMRGRPGAPFPRRRSRPHDYGRPPGLEPPPGEPQ
jgi:Spy/CpxP family protein refolding chaperone